MQHRYHGGVQEVSVVFPDRVLEAVSGEVYDLTDAEAAAIADHPEWTAVDAPADTPLASMKRAELVELAGSAGVDTTGTKADLIARLTADEPTTTTPGDPAASQEG